MKTNLYYWSYLTQFFVEWEMLSCIENKNTHFMFNNFFFKPCRLWRIWKKCWAGTPQMTVWSMRIAWWIPMATNTHSEYVILIAFPMQQRLHERASMLRCTLDCLNCYLDECREKNMPLRPPYKFLPIHHSWPPPYKFNAISTMKFIRRRWIIQQFTNQKPTWLLEL